MDQTSHFDGDWKEGQKHAPQILAFDTREELQIAFAEIDTAYDGVNLQRLVAIMPGQTGRDYVIDIMRGLSDQPHTYDLPIHFKGQVIETSFDMAHATDRLEPLGDANGYQHLWRRSESDVLAGTEVTSWLLGDQFYSLSFAADLDPMAYFAELGANDPDHNLRHERALILRTQGEAVTYVSVYERHGRYDSDEEVTVFDGASVGDIAIGTQSGITTVTIEFESGETLVFRLAERGPTRAPLRVELTRNQITEQFEYARGG